MHTIIRSLSALTLGFAAGSALAEPPPVTVKQEGQTFEHFCAEEEGAVFIGSNNQITASGGCTSIRVEGSNNIVSIGRTTSIAINGDQNRITWQSNANGNVKPPVSDVGKGNTVRHADEDASQ
ncbi:DUF3060 domain-containing protein [Tahibacter soli]|uniref:DUF3060 domain-containing protein n=1 Tax=Tahibacter soli TaxID=2983605 RepID=A0A9X3YGA8_9GAMM|nr:DUF3060 domain-containing protein [Tahibacter soli]MDC8011634.1 DUF3060 domain-containing protein [Tahibacter soli]